MLQRKTSHLRLIQKQFYFQLSGETVINLARGAIVILVAVTIALLVGCSTSPSSVTHPKASADAGKMPSGDLGRSPDAVVVPATLPRVPVIQSRALCRDIPALTELEVARANSLPQNHITFSFPARVVVTNPASARAVATVLCGLPRDTIINCPIDLGISYWLYFSPARLQLSPVEADPAGCAYILGLGVPARWALPRFWRTLATAMHLLRPGESEEALYILFAGHLPDA